MKEYDEDRYDAWLEQKFDEIECELRNKIDRYFKVFDYRISFSMGNKLMNESKNSEPMFWWIDETFDLSDEEMAVLKDDKKKLEEILLDQGECDE